MFFVFLIIFIAVAAVFISRQPAEFCITRSITISAPASAIFPQANNLHNFNLWNPWAKLDPNSTSTFEGAEEGVGAIMRWEGNNNVGKGSMTATESLPNELIRFRMEFLKPMKATNTAEFTFAPNGDTTLVTWSMSGTNNFIGKAMGLVLNCDKMVGSQFEKGLASLKAIVEAKA